LILLWLEKMTAINVLSSARSRFLASLTVGSVYFTINTGFPQILKSRTQTRATQRLDFLLP